MYFRIISYTTIALTCVLSGYYFFVNDRLTRHPLHILWIDTPYATDLRNILDEFTSETNISVVVEEVPQSIYWESIDRDIHNGRPTFDIVIADSRWMKNSVARGYFADITENVTTSWLYKNTEGLRRVSGYYSFPDKPNTFATVGGIVDVYTLIYRKDLFENEKNKADFFDIYHYELTPPQNSIQLADSAVFFNQNVDSIDGVALPFSKNTPQNESIDTYLAVLVAMGGTPSFDDPLSVKALSTLRTLTTTTSEPVMETDSVLAQNNMRFTHGEVAMIITRTEYAHALLKHIEQSELTLNQIGVMPLLPDTAKEQYTYTYSIGLVNNAPDTAAAKKFLSWWQTKRAQEYLIEEDLFLIATPLQKNTRAATTSYITAYQNTKKLITMPYNFYKADSNRITELLMKYLSDKNIDATSTLTHIKEEVAKSDVYIQE